jgi:16S rRNA (guanine966-N2)-methyltransferase
MVSEVRIIGGKWKRRKIRFDASAGVRPSLGRVRETLFNWLGPAVAGTRCLDLFAGSGALGLEALSRGAREVIFVDSSRVVTRTLERQLAELATPMPVARCDALAYLQRLGRQQPEPFELIFADPPFDGPLLEQAVASIARLDLLAPAGHLYFEARRGSISDWPGWETVKMSRAGDNEFGLLARAS